MGCLNSTTKVHHFDHSKENGVVPTHQKNGHIPSSTNTPRETLGQLPDLKEDHADTDSRITETPSTEQTRNASVVQPIVIRQNTADSGLDQSNSNPGSPREKTLTQRSAARISGEQTVRSSGDQTVRSSGDQSQRSTNRESIVVPTMPVTEEDLLRSHYTIKELSIHNQEKGYIDIFPFKNLIYSTAKFKDAMKRVVKQKYETFKEENMDYDENYEYEKDFYEPWKKSPIFLVLFTYNKMHLRFSDVKNELPGCKVATVLDKGDLYVDIVEDSRGVVKDLQGKVKRTENEQDFLEFLERFLALCDNLVNSPNNTNSFSNTTENGTKSINSNFNDIEFPLLEAIEAAPLVLRKWVEKWQPFDIELPEEGVLTEMPDAVVNAMTDPLELQDICRVSSDGLPGFDFTIDGEAAWDVIELDIVKNDKSTDKQERIWRSRENRTDLNDPMFLLSRQTRLEMYFLNKYEWPSSKLDPYRGFTSRLQKAWKEFEALSGLEEFTIIPEDEY